MAIPLKIPTGSEDSLRELARLSDDEAGRLVDVFASVKVPATLRQLTETVAQRSELGHAGKLADVLVSLRLFMDQRGYQSRQVAQAVAIDAKQKDLLSDAPGAAASLENRISRLLLTKPVTVAAKAFDLFLEDHETFWSARILTDIRPVFVDEGDALEEAAAILVHTLRVYHGDGKTTHFSLRPHDLRRLKKVLDRAIRKEERLRQSLGTALWPLLEEQDEED